MLKLYHTSDVHIGVQNRYFGDEFLDIQKKFLNILFDDAVKEDVKYIVIAGDLFDSNFIPSKIANEIFEIFLNYKEINTIIIPGGGIRTSEGISGHDAYVARSIYRRPDIEIFLKEPNIHLLTPDNPTTKIDDVAFYAGFFDIPKVEKLDGMYHIAVVHGCFSDHPRENEISISSLEDTFFDYICLGHYHFYKKFHKSAYSGSLVQFEFLKAKDATSGYVEVKIADSIDINYIFFDNAPRFLKMDILNKEDLEFIKNIDNNTYIQITGYSKELEDKISEFISQNIVLSDYPVIYERDEIYELIENSLDEILFKLCNELNSNIDEIREFILNNLNGNLTKPAIEEYLQTRFDI